MSEKISKIKNFFLKYEHKIVICIGFVLVSAISYEFGILQGQKWQQKPLIIEKPSDTPQEGITDQKEAPGGPGSISEQSSSLKLEASSSKCVYVGSKNSDKFYLPTCSYAKRVKPENLVCFKSADEALKQGRTESKCK